MLGCGTLPSCGCHNTTSSDLSYSSESSSSDADMRRNQGSSCQEVVKHNGVGAFLAALSPRNLFRGFKKNSEFSMPKAERTMKAAILIQQWYRRYLARMEVRRRYTWTIFQSIEYQGEQDQVKLYNFFNALLTHIPTTPSSHKPITSDTTSKSSSTDTTVETKFEDESPSDGGSSPNQFVESNYKGIHLGNPLSRQDLDNLIESFRKKKTHRLHAKYVATILKQATAALKKLPNLNVASTAISKQITVCGDLHGKLEDLLIIFHKNGLPSAENPYVFNGDFVDRGKKGLEVLLLLLAVLLVFPDGVFLNRGNHEDHVMNTRYGFIREVKLKYKHNAERLLKLIEGVYRWLPLGTVVNNKVLIVHGGISDITDLDWVRSLDRQKYVSLLRPPVVPETNNAVATEAIDKMEWKQVFDILWSDPQGTEGCIPNSLRGAGTYFGPDVTEQFLAKHNLMFIIRSHECKIDGYELTHNDKVVTIFSASNYYETGSNKGAYMKLVGPQLVPHFVQFNTARSVAKALTFRQKVGLVESSAIRELSTKVQAHREKLIVAFRRSDNHDTGLVTVSEWCSAMEETTGLSLPWRMLKEKLVLMDPAGSGKVRYMTTFQDIEPARRGHGATVVETLYRNKSSLEAIFRIIDKDNSGYISLEEFKDACELLGEHLQHPQDEALDICKSMDINKDGLVDLNEFLETFRLVDMEVGRGDSVDVDSDDEGDRD
ncbi:serine/threonine-protein phosphatase rdgC-like [Macrosteles quadrilineatus]|uniref:serine/threonine-protein phosphatase rdgC-like n=1 Tax=Macrosteles quadrilineatus TaxID=74068 RepID=UPI0023E2AE76|nr:serine/threonine-protein phosphatase rdgC-like isoform X2 [Macrosteles quadrilineatus]XP_054269073.1 serine/threonine-protein phosphatase rdgC-like [Macrosteles quadrilineatus]